MSATASLTGSPVNEIAAAKIKVMRAVPYIQKLGKMDAAGAKYNYAREADFIAALHPAMIDAGLTLGVSNYEAISQSPGQTKSGTANVRVVILATVRFTHAMSGQFEDVKAFGEGIDTGDKAFNKAMTGAMKYALRQTFMVETGDDPDDTRPEESLTVDDIIGNMKAGLNAAANIAQLQAKWQMIYRDRGLVNGRFNEVEKYKDAKKAQLAATEPATTNGAK